MASLWHLSLNVCGLISTLITFLKPVFERGPEVREDKKRLVLITELVIGNSALCVMGRVKSQGYLTNMG